MILGIQIFGIIFGVGLLYFTFISYKKKEMSFLESAFWGVFWLVFMYLILFPHTLDFFVTSLNLVRTLDLFTIGGFMFLIALTFYNYIINMQNRRKVERVVRALAMERADSSGHQSRRTKQ